jgi:hypothetical protein
VDDSIEIKWTSNGVLIMPTPRRDYGHFEVDKCFVFNEYADFQKHIRKWWNEQSKLRDLS